MEIRMTRRWLVVILLLAWPALVSAQTPPVKNPTGVVFTSVDHLLLSAYEVDIVREGDGIVMQTLTLTPPAPLPNGEIQLAFNVQPITFGAYRFVIRAVAGTVKSEGSAPSDQWQRVPGAPSKPLVK